MATRKAGEDSRVMDAREIDRRVQLWTGDTRSLLGALAAESVHCVVTSPQSSKGIDSGEVVATHTMRTNPAGRNPRTVWTISTRSFKSAHFATFAPAIPERCIRASTSVCVCSECGGPWAPIVERVNVTHRREPAHQPGNSPTKVDCTGWKPTTGATIGYRPTCTCNANTTPAIVLDPFNGAGTTGLVALRLGRNYIGFDITQDYIDMTRKRLIEQL